VRIAIIGSGIAGLTASHLLHKQGHEVHLYEAQEQLGLSAHSVDFNFLENDSSLSVCGDVPSRMFNSSLWPNVVELYRSLELDIAQVNAKQSYRRGDDVSALLFQLPFEWSTEIMKTANSSLLALSGSLGIRRKSKEQSFNGGLTNAPISDRRFIFLAEINRLRKQGLNDLKNLDPKMTFQEYLDQHNFSAKFRETFLYPALSSTVCTCSHEAISCYPAVILLEAMQHISGSQRLCRVVKGARLIAERLSENVTVKLATPVKRIAASPQSAKLTADGIVIDYDHVVIATQANQAAGLCLGLAATDSATLNGFSYEDVDVVIHTDEKFMPPAKKEWSMFNFVASDQHHESMCTVWMNQFHDDWQDTGMTQPIFQTIRPIHEVEPDKLIRHIKLQRPLVNHRSWSLWQQLRTIHQQQDRRIWFCGSYAMPGIPLLESAVRSAIEISNLISDT